MSQSWRKLARKFFIDLDLDQGNSTILITGIARSGTTWLSEIINHDNSHRDIFEPFLSFKVDLIGKYRLHQYIRPGERDPYFVDSAKRILSGRIRNPWTDWGNRKFITTKRIIKDVRTNLMLKWLHELRPEMSILLLVRHPLSIYNSWKKLEWGIGSEFGVGDFDEIVRQDQLFSDHPLIAENLTRIDRDNYFEQMIFMWCVFYYLPLKEMNPQDYLFVFYENLLLDPENEFKRVFSYLKKPLNFQQISQKVKMPSKTNYNKILFSSPSDALIQSWKKDVSEQEAARAQEILKMFKLDGFYTNEGFPNNQYTLPQE